jgi:exodeoxyribonuclease-3
MKKVITWNVNSINKRYEHVNLLLNNEKPHVLLLQEVKSKTFPDFNNYFSYVNSNCGYAGVAILSLSPMEIVEQWENRMILTKDENDMYFCCVYVPNGFSQKASLEIKLSFFEKLYELILKYNNLVLGGDMNVCYKETECSIDNPYRISEKNWLRKFESVLKDSTKGNHLTWFDYRQKFIQFGLNGIARGLGLDKIYVSRDLDCSISQILLKYRNLSSPSDHAPVVSEISKQIF